MLSQSLEGKRVKIICTDGEEFKELFRIIYFQTTTNQRESQQSTLKIVHRDLDCVSASMKMKSSQLKYWGRP